MRRPRAAIVAAAVGAGTLAALAVPGASHSGLPDLDCVLVDNQNVFVLEYQAEDNWEDGTNTATFTLSVPTDGQTSAEFVSGGTATATLSAPAGYVGPVVGEVVAVDGVDGFVNREPIRQNVVCPEPTPPPPPPEPPAPPPPAPPAPPPPPVTPPPVVPPPVTPPPVVPPPDKPPTRKVRMRMRTVRGCIGPWRQKPRTAIRTKRGPDGKWYSFRDVRKVTYITITKPDGTVKRGRRVQIRFRGTYCGPVSPRVTG